MRKHGRRAISLSLSLLLIIVATTPGSAQTGARRRQRPARSGDAVLFDAMGYGGEQILLPIVIVRGGRFVAPPAFNMKAARRQSLLRITVRARNTDCSASTARSAR
ncbi:MAG TPA: hypothetical protein VN256_07440 [Pyrinomonadaceae bacterium]|nr:hypothetical protein [Pyrinomonadaceae bacterium]